MGKPITVSDDFIATTDTWLNIDGETEYFNVYSFTTTLAGTFKFSATTIPQGATVTINGETLTTELSVTMEQGDTVEIVFTGTENGQTANVSFAMNG